MCSDHTALCTLQHVLQNSQCTQQFFIHTTPCTVRTIACTVHCSLYRMNNVHNTAFFTVYCDFANLSADTHVLRCYSPCPTFWNICIYQAHEERSCHCSVQCAVVGLYSVHCTVYNEQGQDFTVYSVFYIDIYILSLNGYCWI